MRKTAAIVKQSETIAIIALILLIKDKHEYYKYDETSNHSYGMHIDKA